MSAPLILSTPPRARMDIALAGLSGRITGRLHHLPPLYARAAVPVLVGLDLLGRALRALRRRSPDAAELMRTLAFARGIHDTGPGAHIGGVSSRFHTMRLPLASTLDVQIAHAPNTLSACLEHNGAVVFCIRSEKDVTSEARAPEISGDTLHAARAVLAGYIMPSDAHAQIDRVEELCSLLGIPADDRLQRPPRAHAA